jgi:hypothetical protein
MPPRAMDKTTPDSPPQTVGTSWAPHSPGKLPKDPDVNEFCRIVARIIIRVLMEEAPKEDNDRENT